MGMVGCIDAPFPDPSQCAVLSGARLGGEDGHAVGGAQRPEEGAIAQVERNGCPFFAVDTDSNSNFQCGLGVGGGMGRVGVVGLAAMIIPEVWWRWVGRRIGIAWGNGGLGGGMEWAGLG